MGTCTKRTESDTWGTNERTNEMVSMSAMFVWGRVFARFCEMSCGTMPCYAMR